MNALGIIFITVYHLNPIMKPTQATQVQAIVIALESGLSMGQIAQKYGVSKATVSRIKSKHLSDLEVQVGGHPRLLTPTSERLLVRKIITDDCSTAQKAQKTLQKELGIKVSTNTIRNTLKKNGFKAVPMVKKPLLTQRH